MTVETLLSRLRKVRQTAPGNWTACCPAHEDKSPSMTIRELDDGTVLLHDFAGCSVESILGAVGLEFDDLFPEKPQDRKPIRRPFNAHDVLKCVAEESLIVAVAASNIRKGIELTQADHERLWLATTRLEEARRLASGEF